MTTKQELAQAVALFKAEYDNFLMDRPRLEMWLRAMEGYADGVVMAAAERHVRSSRFAPQMAEILRLCEVQQGGSWLTADEAWALAPRHETESALITSEIAEAIDTARQAGDRIAGRMAFKEAYERLTEQARLEGRQPRYFLSAGTDPYGCAAALAKGVQTRRITLERAAELKPELANDVARMCSRSADGRPLLSGPDQATAQKLLAGPSDTGKQAVKSILANLRALSAPQKQVAE